MHDHERLLDELRPVAFAIAYRMLGSVSEAEDVVQEALLRLHLALQAGEQMASPHAFVATVTTRLAINELRSARVRRERYVGEWLPEPIITDGPDDPGWHAEMADSVSQAMLVLLESLSPEQRAVLPPAGGPSCTRRSGIALGRIGQVGATAQARSLCVPSSNNSSRIGQTHPNRLSRGEEVRCVTPALATPLGRQDPRVAPQLCGRPAECQGLGALLARQRRPVAKRLAALVALDNVDAFEYDRGPRNRAACGARQQLGTDRHANKCTCRPEPGRGRESILRADSQGAAGPARGQARTPPRQPAIRPGKAGDQRGGHGSPSVRFGDHEALGLGPIMLLLRDVTSTPEARDILAMMGALGLRPIRRAGRGSRGR